MSVVITKNDRTNLKLIGLREHTCAICNKKFECRAEYIFKKGTEKKCIYYCSWTCMRKAEKIAEEQLKERKARWTEINV